MDQSTTHFWKMYAHKNNSYYGKNRQYGTGSSLEDLDNLKHYFLSLGFTVVCVKDQWAPKEGGGQSMIHGPTFLTNDPATALAAWEADHEQWIRTDGINYAIGYEDMIFDDDFCDEAGWRDNSPEEIQSMYLFNS